MGRLGIRTAIRAAALLGIVGGILTLALFVFFARAAERYTAGETPQQFHRSLDSRLLDDYSGVFGIAHNSGDSLAATREALAHGADVIEIDVVSLNGELWAGHDSPLPLLGKRFFRGPRLANVWAEATSADFVKLDLKETSRGFLRLLISFLDNHRDHEVAVATGSADTLRILRAEAPHAIRILSVPRPETIDELKRDPELIRLIDGVTIRESALDDKRARWLEERRLLVVAWTVNDAERMNELVHLGVDGLTTDNLAIMELLGGQERGERGLTHRVSER